MGRGRKQMGNSPKIPVTFSVETDVVQQLKEHCIRNDKSASAIVQRKIIEYLTEEKK